MDQTAKDQNQQPQQPQRSNPYIDYLEGLVVKRRQDVLAALRQGLGKSPDEAMDMHRYMAPWLGECSEWERQVFYLIASLFAYWHQGESGSRNNVPKDLGASMAALGALKTDSLPGLERRFTGLLKSHRDALPHHLRQIVSILRSGGVPVNWNRLFWDLRRWNYQGGKTQRQWATSFFRRQPENDEK